MDSSTVQVFIAVIGVAGAAIATMRAITSQAITQTSQNQKDTAASMAALSKNLDNHFQENRTILREMTTQMSALSQYMVTQTELIRLILSQTRDTTPPREH
jgi:uncharacterized membrane-anchored protein YhcB (DUF1043 family)